ncbi:MAG TPA: hypothetical protein VFF14_06475 [Candidatus Deferrimicrobium sp.]|nr:hypothetical protein [Candidatus Deferrimicrobium sp.]
MGSNKKNSRAKDPLVTSNRMFTEFDMQSKRNMDQNVQTQGKKIPTVMPKSTPYH